MTEEPSEEYETTLAVSTITAVQHIRRMRGGAQAQMMRCSDGNYYVVKFQNNPQGLRILANEMFATQLARICGLPVPRMAIVEVTGWLIKHTQELTIQLLGSAIPCQTGLQFGSCYAVSPLEGQVFDYLPVEMLSRVRNIECFYGMLVFDKWTGNSDGRQATFWRKAQDRRYSTSFIDQGYCFDANEWGFQDQPLRGVYPRSEVYEGLFGWDCFEPWLSRIEHLDDELIWRAAERIPPEWYRAEWDRLACLVRHLIERKNYLRNLISQLIDSPKTPLTNWARKGTGRDRTKLRAVSR
jgi:HipA-like kinase